ncbi:MAG TPA: DUF1475 family protein [Candidatus Didemnitutus sp.]|nr:DUF1475 family protein [Candidatus Didemnitutus sp.]
MIVALRIFFAVVLVSMLTVTSWAGRQVPLWQIPRSVGGHPWFIATLFDTYWGFLTFYVWQWYREPAWVSRLLWFLAIVLLGNIAMSSYGLMVVSRLSRDAKPEQLLLRGEPVSPVLPAALLAAFGAICAIASAF